MNVMEIMISAVSKEVFGRTSNPDDPDFKSCKESWDSLADRRKSNFKTLNIVNSITIVNSSNRNTLS